MWGNRLGWGISGFIVLLTLFVGWQLLISTEITPPTDLSTNEANLDPLAVPIPGDVVDQSKPGDAGDLYRQAINAYDENAAEDFVKTPTGDKPQSIDLVLQAANIAQMNLYLKKPEELVNYAATHDSLETLASLGNNVLGAGIVLCKSGNLTDGKKYLQAGFALGAKLVNERVCYDEYLKGIGLMQGALEELALFAPNGSDERTQFMADKAALSDYDTNHVRPIWDAISSIRQDVIAVHAGDVFKFARDSRDRMVRVEAILKLGRYHYDAARDADQIRCLHVASEFVTDPDPAVSTAARAARDLTIQQYRMIH